MFIDTQPLDNLADEQKNPQVANDKFWDQYDPSDPLTMTDTPTLQADSLNAFLSVVMQPREMVLAPIIPSQGLAMIYSWRGLGKTNVALGIAFAVATGGNFLKWQAPKARRVLYLDGEMPGRIMQERLTALVNEGGRIPDDNLFIVNGDRQQPGAMPNLATEEGQHQVEAWIEREGISLLVVDNIATLCQVRQDNEAASWQPMQGWLLSLRRRGVSVLLVHHAGKGGAQRGTSSREDILDTSISLKRPTDYVSSEGCRVQVNYEKARGLFGSDAEPFEARMEMTDGKAVWTMHNVENANLTRIRELIGAGLSLSEIAEELGISKTSAHRLKRQLEAADASSQRSDP